MHPFIHACIHSFINSFILSFVRSLINVFGHSFCYFVRSFVRSFIGLDQSGSGAAVAVIAAHVRCINAIELNPTGTMVSQAVRFSVCQSASQ
jgi:hypothetical protein